MKTFSKWRKKCFNGRHLLRQFLLVPILFSLLFPPLLMGANQQEKITINLKEVNIIDFFNEIERISPYKFFYKNSQVESLPKISIEAFEETIVSILNKVFSKTNLTYILNDKQIVIQQKIGLQTDVVKISVSGQVVFSEDSSPAPNANIMVKGIRGLGTTTGLDGKFTINNVPKDATLIVSFIGYITQEIQVNGRAVINIALIEDEALLQEVYVTGYQTLPKERATGSFSKIDTKELERTLSYSIQDKIINGTLSGLNHDPNTGISVRGVATINASRLPLIIVDGFPLQVDISHSTSQDDALDFENLSRALNSINPNDVESVTVLKDAAAASIYGARAANGVIVINLKKTSAKISEPEVNFSTNFSFKPKPNVNKLPYCNPETYFQIEKSRYEAGWYTNNTTSATEYTNMADYFYVRARVRDGILTQKDLLDLEYQMQTYDNRKEFSDYFLQNSAHQQYNISVNQRVGFNNYRFSIAYDKDLAHNKGNNDDRFVVNFSNQAKPLDWLVITTSVNLNLRNEEKNGVTMTDLFNIPQHQRILDENGNYTSMSKGIQGGISTGRQIRDDVVKMYNYFPYDWKWNIKQEWDNMDNTIKSVSTRLQGGIQAKPFGDILTIDAKYQYEFGSSKQKNYYNEQTFLVRNLVNTFAQPALLPVPKGGILEHQYGTNYAHNFLATALFNKTFNKHNVVALGGIEIREQNSDRSNVRRYGYDPQTLAYVAQIDFLTKFPRNLMANQSPYFIDPQAQWTTIYNFYDKIDRFVSWFGNVAYNYNDKYDFTASWRLDQSNMFGDSPKYRQVPLWSLGLGWSIDKEPFFKLDFVDRLRLRATYGSSGNVDKSTSPYAIAGIGGSYTNSTLALPGAKYTNPANPELRWEKTKQVNIGLEFSLLNNRISGTVDYYFKNSEDLLATKNINSTYGFTSAKFNVGAIQNNGIDITIAHTLKKGAFSWRTQLIYSHNKNVITKTDKDIILNNTSISTALMYQQYRVVQGRPRFNLLSMPWGGLDKDGFPQFIFKDSVYNWQTPQNPTWTNYKFADLKYEGTTLAPNYGSWNNIFSYKGFELSMLLSYKFGHVYQHTAPFRVSNNDLFGIAQGNYISRYAKEFEQMWKNPGDELKTDIPRMPYHLTGAQVRALTIWYTYPVNYGSHLTESAAHIRFQRISLAYSLGRKILPKMFSRMTFTMQGRNLGIIAFNKYHEDPEYLPDMMGNFILSTSPEFTFSIMATF
ncbi:MAG: hypothetical protein CVU10_01585 [Bacteroidetes bacterium HGW-Bacteroidetes-5]|nr:MAG: hypothetical protein CVU10_01585 [Bacteroidetes bacterium HGW-Bacteroidetes-5]